MLGAMRTAFIGAAGVVEEAAPSRTAVTITANGGAQVSTAQSKFGGSSLYINNNGHLLCEDYNFGSGDFTAEFWVYFNSFNADDGLIELRGTNNYGQIVRTIFMHGVSGNQTLAYYNGGGWASYGDFNAGQWYHCAVCREGSTVNVYRDGVRIGQTTDSGTFVEGNFIIGAGVNGNLPIDGYMDEVRLSTAARYTGTSYTVPTAEFTNDADTIFLCHMNGANGSTTFVDDNA